MNLFNAGRQFGQDFEWTRHSKPFLQS